MSGLAFEQARRRVAETLEAGTLEVLDPQFGLREVDCCLVVAMHTQVPREETERWAVDFAMRAVFAIANGANPVGMIAGLCMQGMLTGYWTAEEAAKGGDAG